MMLCPFNLNIGWSLSKAPPPLPDPARGLGSRSANLKQPPPLPANVRRGTAGPKRGWVFPGDEAKALRQPTPTGPTIEAIEYPAIRIGAEKKFHTITTNHRRRHAAWLLTNTKK